MTYIGRFAPSPSGPLHFGSLVAALGSWLDARANSGQWLLRIEDLDPPREMVAATELIIESLKCHGLFWDGDITYQSDRLDVYEQVLQQLTKEEQTYPCYCSRRQIRELGGLHLRCANQPPSEGVYSHRLKVDNNNHEFTDVFHGLVTTSETQATEDFILKRKDGLHAYMLAVVVDDIHQKITHIIRGADLLTTTCQQIYLFKALNSPPPVFGHLPLATRENGDKLSKQNHAPAIHDSQAVLNLCEALKFLGQSVPENYQAMNVDQLLECATKNWQPKAFKGNESTIVSKVYSH